MSDRNATATVAALYVQSGGAYFGLPGVDPWDEQRDARRYDGPYPVVAHPPCAAYCAWASLRELAGYGKRGEDGGCFAHALESVRRFGGVLEHPSHSDAWKIFGLPEPVTHGWTASLLDEGFTTEIDQGAYGHLTSKPTWLYYVGGDPPALRWGELGSPWQTTKNASSRQRSRTPEAFRDALLSMARSARAAAVAA